MWRVDAKELDIPQVFLELGIKEIEGGISDMEGNHYGRYQACNSASSGLSVKGICCCHDLKCKCSIWLPVRNRGYPATVRIVLMWLLDGRTLNETDHKKASIDIRAALGMKRR